MGEKWEKMGITLLKYVLDPENFDTTLAIKGQIITMDKNKSIAHNAKDLQVLVDENNCWNVVSHCLDNRGYGQYMKERTHVFVYKKFIGKILKGQVVRHKCDNPKCCNPSHLEIGTQKDNADDRENRNRGNHYKKLTTEEVIEIAKSDLRGCELALIYDVSHSTISDIKRKRRRQNILKDIEIVESKTKLLPEDIVIKIFLSNEKTNIIADKFNISRATVCDIKSKRRYKKYLGGIAI